MVIESSVRAWAQASFHGVRHAQGRTEGFSREPLERTERSGGVMDALEQVETRQACKAQVVAQGEGTGKGWGEERSSGGDDKELGRRNAQLSVFMPACLFFLFLSLNVKFCPACHRFYAMPLSHAKEKPSLPCSTCLKMKACFCFSIIIHPSEKQRHRVHVLSPSKCQMLPPNVLPSPISSIHVLNCR